MCVCDARDLNTHQIKTQHQARRVVATRCEVEATTSLLSQVACSTLHMLPSNANQHHLPYPVHMPPISYLFPSVRFLYIHAICCSDYFQHTVEVSGLEDTCYLTCGIRYLNTT